MRIFPSSIVNFHAERFTSGGSSSSFIRRHSSTSVSNRLESPISLDIVAAMNSAGWFALSQAHW